MAGIDLWGQHTLRIPCSHMNLYNHYNNCKKNVNHYNHCHLLAALQQAIDDDVRGCSSGRVAQWYHYASRGWKRTLWEWGVADVMTSWRNDVIKQGTLYSDTNFGANSLVKLGLEHRVLLPNLNITMRDPWCGSVTSLWCYHVVNIMPWHHCGGKASPACQLVGSRQKSMKPGNSLPLLETGSLNQWIDFRAANWLRPRSH